MPHRISVQGSCQEGTLSINQAISQCNDCHGCHKHCAPVWRGYLTWALPSHLSTDEAGAFKVNEEFEPLWNRCSTLTLEYEMSKLHASTLRHVCMTNAAECLAVPQQRWWSEALMSYVNSVSTVLWDKLHPFDNAETQESPVGNFQESVSQKLHAIFV